MRCEVRLPVVMGFVLAAAAAAPAQQNPASLAQEKRSAVRVQKLEAENAKLRADNKRLAAELAQLRSEAKRGRAQDLDRTVESVRKITKKLEANEGLLGRLLGKQGGAKHQAIFAQLAVPQAGHFRVVFEQAARQSDEVPAPRLVRGDVEKAVRTLEHAMTYLKAAKNYGEAFRHLDQANKALMEARVALWEQRGAAEKKGGSEKQEKPVRNERSKKRP